MGPCLLFEGMGRMIGAQDIDDALIQPSPQASPVIRVADGRVHLSEPPQPLIGLRPFQGQMLRGGLNRCNILIAGEKGHLLGCRDMLSMDAFSEHPRQSNEALGGLQCGLGAAHLRVTCPIARARQPTAVCKPILVLGVEGATAVNMPQHIGHALVVSDQQAPPRRTHEDFHTAASVEALELAKARGVFVGAPT